MKVALGVLKLTPSVFYGMTIREFEIAFDGHCMVNGIEKKTGVTRNEFLTAIGK